MSIGSGYIDVHHHNIPDAFKKAMADRGLTEVAGTRLPAWSPAASIGVMDDNDVRTAITSLSAPGVHFGGGMEQARALARECNEFSARMVADFPGRFGFFAVLPMPFAEASCEEAAYALDTLKADGIVLLGSTDGVFLGDPCLDELMAELDRRSAVVFEHPNINPTSDSLRLDIPGFYLEFLCDTTRAALNLILSGTMERHPRIAWILSHSGGFLPYVAWRAALAGNFPEYAERAPDGILSYIRRFYYDTALAPSRHSQVVLKELVDPSHILFGSDFPFAPARLVDVECDLLPRSGLWSEDEQRGIDRGNALRLFPKYREPDEPALGRPSAARPSLGRGARRFVNRAVARFASGLQR